MCLSEVCASVKLKSLNIERIESIFLVFNGNGNSVILSSPSYCPPPRPIGFVVLKNYLFCPNCPFFIYRACTPRLFEQIIWTRFYKALLNFKLMRLVNYNRFLLLIFFLTNIVFRPGGWSGRVWWPRTRRIQPGNKFSNSILFSLENLAQKESLNYGTPVPIWWIS
jgi:hypothetical protein